MSTPEPHTQLTKAIGTDRAIIMGDPARMDTIGKLMENVREWAYNRESLLLMLFMLTVCGQEAELTTKAAQGQKIRIQLTTITNKYILILNSPRTKTFNRRRYHE